MGKSIKEKSGDSTNSTNSDPSLEISPMDNESMNAESETMRDLDSPGNEEERDLDDQVHQPVPDKRPPGMDA